MRPMLLVLAAVAAVTAGCRESVEARFIYYPSRTVGVDPSRVGLRYRDVTFSAEDGVRLHGWLIPGRVPTTLLYSHGNAGNIGDRLAIARLLVDQLGIGVFMYDYRGYGKSEGTPSEAGLSSDARGARGALLREGVAPEHVVYYGRSLGASVTVDLAVAHPPRAVVLESPFTSVRSMANGILPGIGHFFRTRWDSLTKIARLQAPLLILHGDADEVVPYAQGQALFAAAPGPKTFFTIRGGRHYHMEAAWSEYWKAWRGFLHDTGLPATAGSGSGNS
jgi:fermentation-respiration switch protein FrsA (DUF1100 family)